MQISSFGLKKFLKNAKTVRQELQIFLQALIKTIILLDLYNDLKDAVEYRVLTNHSHIVAQPLMETYTSLCDVLDVFLDNNKIKYFDEFLLWCNLSSYVIDFYK